MNSESQINELLTKVNDISSELKECRKEIELLKTEIENLKRKPIQVKRATSATTFETFTFENFIGLKVIHFVGIVVLLIGLTIGVKYAIDINLISPALRILIAYLAGCSLFLISLRLKKKYKLFSMVLFSGAMASIYFTTYAAFAYYEMLSRTVVFILMLAFTIFTVLNSLKYDKQEIAILGLVGAYGIPFFVRGNEDNLWGLFFYLFIINTGILFLSFRKYWLSLTYLSFFTTWIIFFAALRLHQESNYFNPLILFCFLFFVLFMIVSVGFKLYRQQSFTNTDAVIIIANTISLYVALIILFSTGNLTFIADMTLLFALVYLSAGIVTKKFLPHQQHLNGSVFSISLLAFITFFFLLYHGLTITITWGLLAIVYFISGMWFKLKIFRIGAIVLFVGTLIKLIAWDSLDFSAVEKIIAYIFTGTILLIVSFLYQKFKKRIFSSADDPNVSS